MSKERRASARFPGPFEGSWDGASGMRECRVTDLSAGGCFIDAYASQPVGARIVTELKIKGHLVRLPAEVVYVDRIQGFAVRFLDSNPEGTQALGEALAALQDSTVAR
jgi:hypothetical protein